MQRPGREHAECIDDVRARRGDPLLADAIDEPRRRGDVADVRAREPHSDDVLADVHEQRVPAERHERERRPTRRHGTGRRRVCDEHQPDRDRRGDERERRRPEPLVDLERARPEESSTRGSTPPSAASSRQRRLRSSSPASHPMSTDATAPAVDGKPFGVVARRAVAVQMVGAERRRRRAARRPCTRARRRRDIRRSWAPRAAIRIRREAPRRTTRDRPPPSQADDHDASEEPGDADPLQHAGDPQRVESAALTPPPEDQESDRDQGERAHDEAPERPRADRRAQPLRHPRAHDARGRAGTRRRRR